MTPLRTTTVESSEHWKRKRKYRADISDEVLLLVISHGVTIRDGRWKGVLNSILRVPPSGRRLKVVYRITGPKKYRIITAYWLD